MDQSKNMTQDELIQQLQQQLKLQQEKSDTLEQQVKRQQEESDAQLKRQQEESDAQMKRQREESDAQLKRQREESDAQLKRQQEESDAQMKREREMHHQQLDLEIEEWKSRLAKAQAEIEFGAHLRSGPASTRYHFLQSSVKVGTFPWSSATQDEVENIWKAVKDDKELKGIPDDPSTFQGDEDRDLHPLVQKLFYKIFEMLQVTNRHLFVRPTLDPPLKPDLCITREGMTKATFRDVGPIVELKVPSVSMRIATDQALDYFIAAMDSKTNDAVVTPSIAAGCNMLSIQAVFCSTKRLYDTMRTNECQLFCKGWRKKDSQVSDGFKLLCNLLKAPLPDSDFVEINDYKIKVRGTIFSSAENAVYICQDFRLGAEPFAVKVGRDRYGVAIVANVELAKYEEISSIQDMTSYILPFKNELHVTDGFAMAHGISLASFIQQRIYSFQDRDRNATYDQIQVLIQEEIIQFFKDLVKGLQVLHHHQWRHLDIRPGNIVIYDDTARFIDWATAVHVPSHNNISILAGFCQGHKDCFWPADPSQYGDKAQFPGLSSKWDALGLAYTLIFVACSRRERIKFVQNREDFLRTSYIQLPDQHLIKKGIAIVKYIGERDSATGLTAADYAHIIHLLT